MLCIGRLFHKHLSKHLYIWNWNKPVMRNIHYRFHIHLEKNRICFWNLFGKIIEFFLIPLVQETSGSPLYPLGQVHTGLSLPDRSFPMEKNMISKIFFKKYLWKKIITRLASCSGTTRIRVTQVLFSKFSTRLKWISSET